MGASHQGHESLTIMRKASTTTLLVSFVLLLLAAGCTMMREDPSSRTVQHRFTQSPQAAGACFARNAERRSSALVAEVSPPDARGRVEVVVNVKNGVEYARLTLRPLGARSEGTIELNVSSRRGTEELVSFLVEGC